MAGVVFINYRGEDSHSYAALLYTELARRFGDDHVFLDAESIPAGADFVEQLLDRVRSARVLLAVIGPHWLTATDPAGQRRIDDPADWIRRELAEAFTAGVRVIPVLTEQADIPAATELPADIAALSRCQYRRLRYREPIGDLTRIAADLAPPTNRLRRRAALVAVAGLVLAAIIVALARFQDPAVTSHTAAPAGHLAHPVADHGPTTSPNSTTTEPTATSAAGKPATITDHAPVAAIATGITTTVPVPPVGCGPVPCRTAQDSTLWAVETGAPNSGICMISADIPSAGGEQTGPDSTCHANDAQFQLVHGSIAGTAQFESVTYPGTCMITPDGYNTYLRPCDPTDPNQWFVVPPSGTTGQIHPYGSGDCLTVHMVANGAIYFAPCGTADQTWQLWQIHPW